MSDNDQATVDRLCLLTYTSDQEGEPHDCVEGADAARAILDAIRKGEVPGVYCSSCDFRDLWKSAEKDLESLRAEVARLKLDVRDAKQAADYNRTCWGNEKARADKAEKRLADYDARLTACDKAPAQESGETATRKCPACGEPVLHRLSPGLGWIPIQYHDCKMEKQ